MERVGALASLAADIQGTILNDPDEMTEQQGHKRLADFIRQNEAGIVKEWIAFRTNTLAG